MSICRECSQDYNDGFQLGNDGYICSNCLSAKESMLSSSKSELSKEKSLKPPSNIWDMLTIIIVGFIAVGGIYLILYFNNMTYSLVIIIMGYIASNGFQRLMRTKSTKHNELFYRERDMKIAELQANIDSLEGQLSSIYQEAVKQREQGRCQLCGRAEQRSKSPFHIHHLADAQAEGNHGLSSLMLLCEDCLPKIDASGHELTKKQRRKKK